MEHNPDAYQYGYDAWQSGYDDAMYDGMDLSSEVACQCEVCRKAYADGQEEALKEIFATSKSAQQKMHLTSGGLTATESLSTPATTGG